jgi:hypothetical protein
MQELDFCEIPLGKYIAKTDMALRLSLRVVPQAMRLSVRCIGSDKFGKGAGGSDAPDTDAPLWLRKILKAVRWRCFHTFFFCALAQDDVVG